MPRVSARRETACKSKAWDVKAELLKIDANRLIAEVQKRPSLWNQRHSSYHNRELTNRLWMDIAAIFKLPKPILKTKWKGLRDTFRAELKKEQLSRIKGKYHQRRPLWIHFKSLQFLKDQMAPRPSIWERNSYCSNNSKNDYDEMEKEHLNGDFSPEYDDSLAEHILRSSAFRASEVGEDIEIKDNLLEQSNGLDCQVNSTVNGLNDEETMLQNLSPEQVLLRESHDGTEALPTINSAGDSDSSFGLTVEPIDSQCYDESYYFLISLLPHMRKLSDERRFFLRLKMQELVYEEVYKKNLMPTQKN